MVGLVGLISPLMSETAPKVLVQGVSTNTSIASLAQQQRPILNGFSAH